MIGFFDGALLGLLQAQAEMQLVQKMREQLSPQDFAKWEADRTAERRHRELCDAIERAGENARPRGLGIFW